MRGIAATIVFFWLTCVAALGGFVFTPPALQTNSVIAAQTQFYVNASTGNDSNLGTLANPWLTLHKVNNSVFASGNTVLLQGSFSGGDNGLIITTTVAPSGSLTLTSYGAGATISSGNSNECVKVTNVPSVTISNLTCTGGGNATNTTNGILVLNNQAGNTTLGGPLISGNTVTSYGVSGIAVQGNNGTSGFIGITISNNTVHDSTGNPGAAFSSCIYMRNEVGVETHTTFSNVTISGNTVFNCTGKSSLSQWTGSGIFVANTATGTVQNNVAHDGGNAGSVGIWTCCSDRMTYQFNEVYNWSNGGGANNDGDGMDIDGSTTNTIFQYNWIHDNAGSCILLFQYAGGNTWSGNTARFNLCQNNNTAGNLSEIFIDAASSATLTSVNVYNNTIYDSINGLAISTGTRGGTISAGNIANNIFYGFAANTLITVGTHGTALAFNGNDYFGSAKFTYNGSNYTTYAAFKSGAGVETINGGFNSNPQIYVPGGGWSNGGNGYVIANLYAYNLQSGSPMLPNAGVDLNANFSLNVGTQDYYGNTVTSSTLPVGAAAADFGTFTASCTSSTNYLARVSSFTKANNANYNSLLCGMNSDGDLANMDAMWVLAAPNSAASLLNLISTSYSLTLHGGVTFTANTGTAGNGTTGYYDTGFNPSSAGGNFVLNSATSGCYDRTSHAADGSQVCIGNNDTTVGSPLLFPRDVFMNDGTGIVCSSAPNNNKGLWIVQRTGSGSGAEACYFNGAAGGGSGAASISIANLNLFIFAENHSSVADTFMSDQISIVFVGGGTMSQSRVSRRINSFMTSLGINTY